MMQEVLFFMVQYDVEAFMAACERKGLAAKTMGSYEQTLRLFGQFLSVREIERTEEVKRVHIESYIDYLQKRGKYTVCAIDAPANSNNPENRSDYEKNIAHDHQQLYAEHEGVLQLVRGTRADTTAKVDENGKVAEDVYLETTEKVEDTTDPIAKATVPANAKTTAAFGDDTVPLVLRVEEAPTANITVSNTFVSEMAESKPWQTITNYQGNLLIAFTAGDEEILSQDTIDGTLETAHARKMNFVNLYGQFYDATHNYTGVEGADDEAVRNRIEAQTAQFFRQTLLWGTL